MIKFASPAYGLNDATITFEGTVLRIKALYDSPDGEREAALLISGVIAYRFSAEPIASPHPESFDALIEVQPDAWASDAIANYPSHLRTREHITYEIYLSNIGLLEIVGTSATLEENPRPDLTLRGTSEPETG